MDRSEKDLSSHYPHLMFLSILIASVLEGVSSLCMTPSGIVNVSNSSKLLHLAFLIKTTHFRESPLPLRFGTTINFVGVNNSGSGKVGIVKAAIHLGVPGYVLFPPKMLSGWKKRCALAFCPSIPDLWQPAWSQQFMLDWDYIMIGEK